MTSLFVLELTKTIVVSVEAETYEEALAAADKEDSEGANSQAWQEGEPIVRCIDEEVRK